MGGAALVVGLALCALPSKAQTSAVAGTSVGGVSLSAPLPAAGSSFGSSQANPFFGSVPPSNAASGGVYALSLREAIDRGLKYNLGLLLAGEGERAARGARLRSLSDLLPHLTAQTSETSEQINLAALGIPAFPGVPRIVGPFGVFDVRAFLSAPLLDLKALNQTRAGSENVLAAHLSYEEARDLVVLVVGGTYLQALADAARIQTTLAQLQTAEALFRQAQDMRNAGLVPVIDVLRSQVEMQAQQQRLLLAQNDFAKRKLALARATGLPVGQELQLTDALPFAPAPPITLEQALDRAYRSRADYRSAQALERSAELEVKAARGQAMPSLQANGDYGVIGPNPGNSHGTFTAAVALKVPIFQGGKVRGDVLEADSVLQQRRQQLSDLRGRVEFDVRSAFLDLKAASDQVQVAQSSLQLSQQQLAQARDRFSAGVANTIEVVQAQEALASSNENYISSVHAHNVAKLSLAGALGIAEEASKEFLGGK